MFASSREMKLFNLTGGRNEAQGFLQYQIIEIGSTSGMCKVCEYFGVAKEGGEAVGSIIGSKFAVGSWGGFVGAYMIAADPC